MKQKTGVMFILIAIILLNPSYVKQQEQTNDQIKTIPDEAIRLRILANSDSHEDQQIKYDVRDKVNEAISNWVQHINDIDEARKLIENTKSDIEEIVMRVLEEQNSSQSA